MTTDTPEVPVDARLPATGADDPPPGWVGPAVVLGLGMPSLGSAARRDVDLLRRLPAMPGGWLPRIRSLPGLPAATLTGIALVLALVFGFVRLGISDVYTESWVFLVLAVILGLMSPAAGLLLTLAFIPLDLLAVTTRGQLDPMLPALAGRAISWWLLWLLAVVLPLVARQVPAAVLAAGRPASAATRRVLGYLGAAASMAGLLWLWTAAVPELVRPVFTWTSMLGNPRPQVTGPVTDGREELLIVAAVAALAWTLMRDLLRVIEDEAAANAEPPLLVQPLPSMPIRVRPVRWAVSAALGVLLLGAMISSPLDVVVLAGALLLSRPGVRRVLRRSPVALLLLGQAPWLLRFAVGCAIAWLVSTLITVVLTGPAFGSERFPIVVATAVAILAIALLMEVDGATDDLLRERDERAAERAAAGAGTGETGATGATGDAGPHPATQNRGGPPDGTWGQAGTEAVRMRPTVARVLRVAAIGGWTALGALALVSSVALAQGQTPCPVGETCLPPASVSAAAATGSAAMLALTLGAGGRFVSKRRDAASRRPAAASTAPDGVGGHVERVRAAVLAAWRAG